MNKRYFVVIACLVAGCGLTTVKTYDGPEMGSDKHAVLSSVGLYPEKKISIVVIEIDGKPMDTERTAEFLLVPGAHTIKVRVQNDLQWGINSLGLAAKSGVATIAMSWKEAFIEIPAAFSAGHTYIPNGRVVGDKASAFLEDAGIDFNRECIPLRRFAIFYGGTSDGKKPGC